MIYLAGVLECHLVIDSGSVSLAPGGVLYDTAVMVRRSVDPRVSVFSRLANDGPGRILLEALVRERIVFDPNLVCESLPSYLVVEDREGRSVTYSGSTSQVCAQSGEMSNALAGNSDVDIVSVLGGGLYYQPLFSSILDSVTFLPQKPYFVLDPASGSFEHLDLPRYVRQIRTALEYADELILSQEDLGLFPDCELSSLAPVVNIVRSGHVVRYQAGEKEEFEGGRQAVYRRLSQRM